MSALLVGEHSLESVTAENTGITTYGEVTLITLATSKVYGYFNIVKHYKSG